MKNTTWYWTTTVFAFLGALSAVLLAVYYTLFGPLWAAGLWTVLSVLNVYSFVVDRPR